MIDLAVRPIAPQWLMLVTLTGVSGWATLRLRAIPASFSISDTFTIAAALLFGPAAGAVTVSADALVMSLRLAAGGRQPARVRVLFNVTVPALTMWIAAQVFFTTAGVGPLAHQPGTIRRVLAPLGLLALLYFVLNTPPRRDGHRIGSRLHAVSSGAPRPQSIRSTRIEIRLPRRT